MNKFSNIQCNEPYVNFTFHNYIECYDDLNVDSIERFTDLFKNLKDHKVSIGNYLVDKKPLQGVKLEETKKNAVRDISQLKHIITNLFKEIDQTNMKEFLFYKSLLIFSDSVGYLNPPELKELNDLFEEVHSYQCDIKYPISKDQLLFYSYNRYPQKSK